MRFFGSYDGGRLYESLKNDEEIADLCTLEICDEVMILVSCTQLMGRNEDESRADLTPNGMTPNGTGRE